MPGGMKMLTSYYDRLLFLQKAGARVFELPDQMLHAYVLLKMRQTGVGGGKYDTLIQEARQFLIDEARRNHGVISYRTNASEFYIDLLGMIDGFCLLYLCAELYVQGIWPLSVYFKSEVWRR